VKVKLALIRQKYNPYGGAERFVERALDAIRAQGVAVTIVTRRWPADNAQQALICNPPYVGSLTRDWGFARGVQRLLQRRDFDLVQSHERIPGCDIYRAGDGVHAEWLRQRSRAMGALARVRVALNPYHAYMKAAEREMFLSSKLRAVICISNMVKREIIEHFSVAENKLHVIYNGVDVEKFHPRLAGEYRAAQRRALGWADGDLLLLLVGSGFERKGVGLVLAALQQLPPHVKLLVVGKDKRLEYYRRFATKLGLNERVHFAGGQNDVLPYYGTADVFVMPTLYEPFGNVILEALASGLPVVTSTKCGGGELVENGREGYVVDALDLTALVAAITALCEPTHRQAAAKAARSRAEAYTWQAMAEQFNALYSKLLAPVGVV
jgi:UDP-glucose:(heptosyl)LPS alpha-1,3-glucosyltransferase